MPVATAKEEREDSAIELGNRDRLNRLLMLMQLQLNDLADEARYAAHIRDWLDARDGRSAERRLLTDPVGHPSLRA